MSILQIPATDPGRAIRRHTWPSIPEAEEALVREAEALTGHTLPREAVSHLVDEVAGKGHAVYSDALLVSVAELHAPAEETPISATIKEFRS